ncbi:hypothetical protein QQS21_006094 [Conoideocrella luteorostrata]|uniref:Mitochondrial pyruvate carrier n=1 Tax=Conoideocrella luteorostrata TaxID=1105319 RepID=A0AAJ0CR04_9HYPO|nr:hypothetical protein QQS21_006094 [Conoideocrella luteorostrata]
MVSASTLMRTSRPLFRQGVFSSQASQAFRAQRFGQQFRFRDSGKRWQSTADGAQQQHQSWFKRMWESEIGIKTVHFWAPVMKWALVLAGISDFARPAEKLSFTQNFALTCTGLIWTRWCLIIKPKNYLLAAVNFFLGLVGIVQVSRILLHESAKKGGITEVVEDVKEDVKEKVKEVKP